MLFTNNDWTSLSDSIERQTVKRLQFEQGKRGGHVGKVYASTSAFLEATELRDLSPFRRLAFEARYRFNQARRAAIADYAESLRQDLTQDDIDFLLSPYCR